jgi:4'-phosphopantetheinyl transferase
VTKSWKLDYGQVHVWQVELDVGESELLLNRELLDQSEKARAASFKFERDRTRWIMARATLRRIVGQYLNLPAHQVNFQCSALGKPFVAPELGLEFNLSHSADLALYAFSTKPVGIDVESIRDVPEALDIAATYFSQPELAELTKTSLENRPAVFLRHWVRHEALLKAQGVGLASVPPPWQTVEAHEGGEWALVDIDVSAGFVASVAMPRSFSIEYRNRNTSGESPMLNWPTR